MELESDPRTYLVLTSTALCERVLVLVIERMFHSMYILHVHPQVCLHAYVQWQCVVSLWLITCVSLVNSPLTQRNMLPFGLCACSFFFMSPLDKDMCL